MPKQAVGRTRQSVGAAPVSSIPTTIKNPARVAHRRTELIEVATKLFLERGFHNTSIRDIARACPFNVASLYMYVSSKEDILYLVAQELIDGIADKLAKTVLDPERPERSLALGYAGYCRIVDRYRRPIRLLYREVGFLPPELRANTLASVSGVISFFEKIIAQGIEAGVFRKIPARLAALDVMVMAHMIALHTREVRMIADLDEYVAFQLDTILAGLLVAPDKRSSRAGVAPVARRRPAGRRLGKR